MCPTSRFPRPSSPAGATWLSCACALLVAACAAEPAPRPQPEPPGLRIERRQPLTGTARSLLKKRMARHGKDMEALLSALLGLDYDETVVVAGRIADEPRLSRPGDATDTANALFPERFFVFQDALHVEAARLVAAARAHDDGDLAESFGRVSATCVGCHAVYLRMPATESAPR
jgi:cytochrome c556